MSHGNFLQRTKTDCDAQREVKQRIELQPPGYDMITKQ
jgi:hypothetical protein